MEFRILGPVEVWQEGDRMPLAGQKQRALLAILLMHRNRVVAADRLIELLWGDDLPETAAHSLQVHVSQLRKVLPPNKLESRPPGYVLRATDDEVDASRFEVRIAEAKQLRDVGDPKGAAQTLRAALSLWRGEPLADVATAPFALAEVNRLAELRLRSLEDCIEAELALGRHPDLVPELEALVAEHPLRERLCAQLMLALYRSGRQAEASNLYYRTRTRLVDELGMEPGSKLQSLLKEIVRQESSLELLAPLETRPTQRPRRRALCPILVGRERELRLLQEAISATSPDGPRLILLAAEAGMGKTRLADELQRCALEAGMQVMWGGCSQAELALPYLSIVEAVGSYLATVELPALKQRLGPMARELSHLFPQLAANDSAFDRSDLGQARLRLFESILALLRVAAERGRLLLVIEDVHWADASTRELLDYLVRRLHQTRISLLLTYRQDELQRGHPLLPLLQGWMRGALATRIELPPLTAESLAGIVSAIFDQGAVTAEFLDYLQARTEGNPFVLEEMLKSAMDHGEIYRTELGWERKALAELKIPSTVRDVILQRLSRLNPAQADVVRAAAVLGESFTYEALVAASGVTEQVVREALRECVEQQLMEAESDQRFRFRHALTRQAIYEDLLGPERGARHFQTAAALRKVPGTPSADIAHHLVLAGRWDQAVPELMRAAEEAENRRGYHEAAALYERALSHVADPVLQARLLCRQAQSSYRAGEPTRAEPLLERGIPVLEQAGHVDEAATHRLTLGSCHWLAGRNDEARQEYERVKTSLEGGAPSEPLAHTYNRLALLDLNDTEMQKAIAMAEAAIATAEAARAEVPRIWAYNFRGCAFASLGSVDAGFADLERSWQEATERGLYEVAGDALSNAIDLKVWCLMASETLPLLDRLGALPDVVHSGGRLATWLYYRRAMAGVVLGDVSSARVAASEALRLAQQADSGTNLIPLIQSWLALAELALGRPDEARRLAERLGEGVATQPLVEQVWAAMTVYVDIGDVDRARSVGARALEYVERAPRLLMQDMWLIDRAVEVLLAAQMPEQAERLRLKAETAPSVVQPLIDRIEGRAALFRGDLTRADERLSAAALAFRDCFYRDDEWRTRRALAEVKVRRGDRAAAEQELWLVVTGAEAHGHVFEATAARRQLRELEQAVGGQELLGQAAHS